MDHQQQPDCKVDTKASQTCAESWKVWYESLDSEKCRKLRETTDKVQTTINEEKSRLKLSPKELEALEKVRTFDDFVSLANRTHEAWTGKRGAKTRDAIQETMENIETFANSWDNLVSALLGMAPFGAGKVAWGVVGVLLTNLLKISKRLPRVDLYNELYATDRMAGFVSRLYTSVMKFLWALFVYFKRSTSGLRRIWRAITSPASSSIVPLITEIEELTMEIYNDGEVGVCVEVRRTREEVESIRLELAESRKLQTATEILESKNDLERMKCLFVLQTYDLEEIRQKANRETSSIPRTASEIQGYSLTQLHPEFVSWYTVMPVMNETSGSRMLWIYSYPRRKAGISQIATDLLDNQSLQTTTAVVTSFHRDESMRSGTELFQECIYQLLLHKPPLVRSYGEVERLRNRKTPLSMMMDELATLFRGVVSAMSDCSRVFWIIDCFDKVSFKGREKLETVIEALKSCVMGKAAKVRILLLSTYAPEDIDRQWDPAEKIVDDGWTADDVRVLNWKF